MTALTRLTLRSISAALLSLHAFTACVSASELVPPDFWDSRERLAVPDLTTLPRLRFLTTTDFPPFNYLDSQRRLTGYHVDLARAICVELAITDRCQIQALPWDELEPALDRKDGEAILAGLSVTTESRTRLAFSRPYLRFPARFVMTRATALAEPLVDKLKGQRVGVVAGTAHEQMLKTYFAGATAVPFPDLPAALAELRADKLDAVFGDGMRLSFWLSGNDAGGCCRFAGGPYLAPEFLGSGLTVAMRPDDTALSQAIDAALQQLSVKGTLGELYLRYFPVSFY